MVPNFGLFVENFKIYGFRALTNEGVNSIPSHNRFLVRASLKKVGYSVKMKTT